MIDTLKLYGGRVLPLEFKIYGNKLSDDQKLVHAALRTDGDRLLDLLLGGRRDSQSEWLDVGMVSLDTETGEHMSDKRLIDCPWCRNPESDRGIGFEDRTVIDTTYRAWFGECECGARGPHGDTPKEAVKLYNEWRHRRCRDERRG
jgi:hypothetical protein